MGEQRLVTKNQTCQLRLVLRRTRVRGTVMEHLACGHTTPSPTDQFGRPTRADRRRCYQCPPRVMEERR